MIEVAQQRPTAIAGPVIAVWVVTGAAVVNQLLGVFTMISGRVLITVGGAEPRVDLTRLPQVNQAEIREGATGFLSDAPLWLRYLCATPSVMHVVVAVLAAVLITGVLRRIATGAPFSPRIRTGLRTLSAVLAIGGVIIGVTDTIAGRAVYDVATSFLSGDRFPLGADYEVVSTKLPRWPFFMIITGIVGFALSAAFQPGGRFEEKTNGVV